jgi:hypothetical protein
MPLPKPNATMKYASDFGNVTEAEIRGIIANPIYAGIGPYPAMVPEEQWVKAAVKAIQEDGAEQFLVNLLSVLRESFQSFENMRGDADEKP